MQIAFKIEVEKWIVFDIIIGRVFVCGTRMY